LHGFDLARRMNNRPVMNRLETIATRQRKFRTRDAMFACFVALAVLMTLTSFGTAWGFLQVHIAQR
jgi:hypothetical protein